MFKRYWWMLLAMAPVGMLAGFMVAAVVTYVMPKKYESSVVIENRPRTKTTMSAMMNQIPATYFRTEFEKIKSRNSLMRVIDSLDLTNKWAIDRESAVQVLKRMVQTDSIRGTDLIQIQVRSTNREDARDIAAEVARAYKGYSDELAAKSFEKGISELNKAVREQEERVEERRKILTTIAKSKGINGGIDPDDVQYYVDAKRDFETDLSLLEQMKLKLITVEISQSSSGDTLVIHEDPVIADAPISPNVMLNLVIGAVGGLLISPFLALPLMWILHRRNPAPAR